MPFTLQKRFQELAVAYGGHLSSSASEALRCLPPGWFEPLKIMIDRVEQILSEGEFATFRWTAFDKKRGSLMASWSGAGDSDVLIDQIVEEAADETAHRCIDCGSSVLMELTDTDGPRCLFHTVLRSGRNRTKAWELSVADLIQAVKSDWHPGAQVAPKTIAAALPLLIQEATAYFRAPDQDAKVITQQIRESFNKLEKRLSPLEN